MINNGHRDVLYYVTCPGFYAMNQSVLNCLRSGAVVLNLDLSARNGSESASANIFTTL